jgi:hypothetical protein
LCVDLRRRLSATTSIDLNRVLILTRITRISFKEISHNSIWKAMASVVDKLVVKGRSSFLAVRIFLRDCATTLRNSTARKIHFHLLHLRNDYAVRPYERGAA